jgi:DNA-binding transcriptional MerR regulator
VTRSKLAGAKAWVCAFAQRKVAGVPSRSARARATASIGSEMSMPVLRPLPPSCRAMASVVLPVPQPTSSTAVAPAAATSSTMKSSKGWNIRSSTSWPSIHARPAGPFHSFVCSSSMLSSGLCSSAIPFSLPLEVDFKSRGGRMKELDIAEVARRSGVPAATLRFYEKRKLITSVGRRGLRRLFEPLVLERLALIALGQAAGFSLDEIARMFAPDGRPRIDRQMLAAKAEQIDRTIRTLSTMRDGLRHAAACRAPSHGECPTFRRLLKAAAAGAFAARPKTPFSQ